MSTEAFPRLPKKIERETRRRFEAALRGALSHYGINRESINLQKDQLVKEAAALLLKHETIRSFRNERGSNERLLFTLAVANALHNESSQKEVRSLVRILKLMSWKYSFYEQAGSYSRRVLRASERGLKTGTRFDAYPIQAKEESFEDSLQAILKKADTYKDKKASRTLQQEADNWGPNSLLNEARCKLKLFNPFDDLDETKNEQDINNFQNNEEYPIVVIVTNLNTEQFIYHFDCSGKHINLGSQRTIILPQSFSKHDFVHEYVHSQIIYDIMTGGYALLFRALNEIAVELVAGEPLVHAYTKLQQIWRRLKEHSPELENLLVDACTTRNDYNLFEQKRDDIFRCIIKKFGLQGFLSISRLESYMRSYQPIRTTTSSVYLSPEIVQKSLH